MSIIRIVILGIVQLFLVGLGVYVSLKPPKKKYYKWLIGIFILCGFVAIGITGYQEYENIRGKEALNTQITSLINIYKIQATTDDIKTLTSEIKTLTSEMRAGFERTISAIKGKSESTVPQKNPWHPSLYLQLKIRG